LTARDRVLLGWLYDHGVLTSFQFAHALFLSLDFCQRRLRTLHRLKLVARFRPLRPGGGSYPHPQRREPAHPSSRSMTPNRRFAAPKTTMKRSAANWKRSLRPSEPR
jgi:hypothetical protein